MDSEMAPDCFFLLLIYLNLIGRKASNWETVQTKDRFPWKRGWGVTQTTFLTGLSTPAKETFSILQRGKNAFTLKIWLPQSQHQQRLHPKPQEHLSLGGNKLECTSTTGLKKYENKCNDQRICQVGSTDGVPPPSKI